MLHASGLSKRFGPVVALDAVDFTVDAGAVHAIVGENGAGKSTLAKIFAGVVDADRGEVIVDGALRRLHGRRSSIAAGIGYVPQTLSLVGALTLIENARLSGLARGAAATREALDAAATDIGMEVPLDVATAALSLAERQLGELLIAVAQGARILLLDEPTSSLGPFEIDRLMGCVRRLARAGTAIVLVTHRIGEVLHTADEVTVLRAGCLVHHGPTVGLDAGTIAELMVGHRPQPPERAPRAAGRVRLAVSDLHVEGDAGATLERVDLSVRAGEIVGIAGVAGSGQRLLAEALVGLAVPSRGRVTVDGVPVTGNARVAARLGVSYVPEDRADGLVATRSIAENASLLGTGEQARTRWGLRRRSVERSWAAGICARFAVRPPLPELPASALSGGNQQKLLMGRELLHGPRHGLGRAPDPTTPPDPTTAPDPTTPAPTAAMSAPATTLGPAVVVAHGPTQGLDLGAAAAVRRELLGAAASGSAVLVISADLDEILDVSDRVVVLAAGRVADEFPVHRGEDGIGPDGERSTGVDAARIGRAMAGLAPEVVGATVRGNAPADPRPDQLIDSSTKG